ncbi:hypothetical protein SEA_THREERNGTARJAY_39 [Mycobacterium phage ThreeRngTarjay]|uniref:hypothetical protein n=1 Tax=Mycobacterium phage Redno2 TaxID=1340709 RepID=UPI000387A5EC|nr:hypothetical protein N860_gp039 [Mycobacterium phage Redno2]AWH13853.1 hypothetical protein SEA_HALLEY_41 [Mycobacterium phage Halley]AXQ52278.1 hypothetical protein SEA_ERICMILLARD_41 [Mycobacterium phage EricMillard]AXQ62449.1 hypothetical protein SEA_ZELINK_42 [Mycobacterium phage Zelink]AYB69528.1 hypothetical protein SEA_KALAH2_41 [Mycobacterium phage Kalah2]QBI99679.1 hypothetical protein SEA_THREERNGTARJAY_39 [Mycobacterium phage ThreeRngTarjay]QBI99990.1 hypothetical protein SEA_PH
MYAKFREAVLKAEVNWLTDTIRVAAIDTDDYTVNLNTHQYLGDIPSGAIVGISVNLADKSVTNGYAKAGTATLPAVTGDEFEAVVVFQHTGSSATSRLIAYVTSDMYESVTPNGSDALVIWHPNGIFRL